MYIWHLQFFARTKQKRTSKARNARRKRNKEKRGMGEIEWRYEKNVRVNELKETNTKGRRDAGKEERKNEGTKRRRDEGTKGRRDEGTKGRRDEGTKGRRDEEQFSLFHSFDYTIWHIIYMLYYMVILRLGWSRPQMQQILKGKTWLFSGLYGEIITVGITNNDP